MKKFNFDFKAEQYVNKESTKSDTINDILTNLNSIINIYDQMTDITVSFEDNMLELINKVRIEGTVSCIIAETFDVYLSEFINRIQMCLKIQMITKFGYNTEIVKNWNENDKTHRYVATFQSLFNEKPVEQLVYEIDNIGLYNYEYTEENICTQTNDIRKNGYISGSVLIKFGKYMSYEFKNSEDLKIINMNEHQFSDMVEKYCTKILGTFHDQINKNNNIVKSSLNYITQLKSLI